MYLMEILYLFILAFVIVFLPRLLYSKKLGKGRKEHVMPIAPYTYFGMVFWLAHLIFFMMYYLIRHEQYFRKEQVYVLAGLFLLVYGSVLIFAKKNVGKN